MAQTPRRKINVRNLSGELVDATDALEEALEDCAVIADAAADAEHAWKAARARALLEIASRTGKLPPADLREAAALAEYEDLHRAYKQTAAAHETAKAGLAVRRSKIESIRTLIASERAMIT